MKLDSLQLNESPAQIANNPRIGILAQPRAAAVLLAGVALLHGLLYLMLVPPWQMPDEPTLFEYAALFNELGRVPGTADRNEALELHIVESMNGARFMHFIGQEDANSSPTTFADIRQHFPLPRQVGGDPPLAFAIHALILRAFSGQSIETQLLALRVFSLLCTTCATYCIFWSAHEIAYRLSPIAFPIAIGAFVALQPMWTFIGSGAGNDAPANLVGAATTLALLRIAMRGATVRRWLIVLVLALLGALVKRSLIPWALMLVPIALFWLSARALRRPGEQRSAAGLAALLWLIMISSTVLLSARLLMAQYDFNAAANWFQGGSNAPAARVEQSAGAALRIVQGQEIVQALPPNAVEQLRNQGLWFRARVWSDEGAQGLLSIAVNGERQSVAFEAGKEPKEFKLLAFVPLRGPPTELIITVESGVVYADRLRASSATLLGRNLALNGELRPALRSNTLLASAANLVRLDEITWAWQSGTWRTIPLGWQQVRYVFASFWGCFGWMTIPLLGQSFWMLLLALICALSVIGIVYTLFSNVLPHPAARLPSANEKGDGGEGNGHGPQLRFSILSITLLPILLLLTMALNATIQTGTAALQQGRYLFPAMTSCALALAGGQYIMIPERWRSRWLIACVAFWSMLAVTGFASVLRFYYG